MMKAGQVFLATSKDYSNTKIWPDCTGDAHPHWHLENVSKCLLLLFHCWWSYEKPKLALSLSPLFLLLHPYQGEVTKTYPDTKIYSLVIHRYSLRQIWGLDCRHLLLREYIIDIAEHKRRFPYTPCTQCHKLTSIPKPILKLQSTHRTLNHWESSPNSGPS